MEIQVCQVCIVKKIRTREYWLLEKRIDLSFALINRKGIPSKSNNLGVITQSIKMIPEGFALMYGLPAGFASNRFDPLDRKLHGEVRTMLGIET